MRQETLLTLLFLAVLVAFFGIKVLGVLLGAVILFFVVLLASLALGAWLLKRRMNRKLRELQQVFAQARKDEANNAQQSQARRNAIDVEAIEKR